MGVRVLYTTSVTLSKRQTQTRRYDLFTWLNNKNSELSSYCNVVVVVVIIVVVVIVVVVVVVVS